MDTRLDHILAVSALVVTTQATPSPKQALYNPDITNGSNSDKHEVKAFSTIDDGTIIL